MTNPVNFEYNTNSPEKVKPSGLDETADLHAYVPSPSAPLKQQEISLAFSKEERALLIAKGKQLLEERLDKDVLDQKHPGSISDSLFAHIHGDSYILDSSLEGSTRSSTLKHFFYFLEKFRPFEHWTDIIHAFKKASFYAERMEALLLISKDWRVDNKQEQLNQLAHTIVDDIFQLKSGQKLIVPGGYQRSSGGHAMLYQFTREQDDTFTMEVLNTGDGLQYHDPEGIKGKIKYYPFKRYEKIARDQTLFRDFMQAALECMIPLAIVDPPYDANYLYQKVFPLLNGIDVSVPVSEQDVITVQRAGTCTERVLHAHCRRHCMQVHGHIGYYKEFKRKYKRQTLIHYYQINKAANRLDDDTVLVNLDKATAKWARSIEKRIAARGLGEQELEEDVALLEAIKEDLDSVKKTLNILSKKPPEVTFPLVPSSDEAVFVSKPESLQNKPQDIPLESIHREPLPRPFLQTISYAILGECALYVESLLKRGTREDHIEAIHFFIDALSMMPMDQTALTHVASPAQCIQSLGRMSEAAFLASYRLNEQSGSPVTQPFLLYQCKVQTLMEVFARKNPQNKLSNYKIRSPLKDLKNTCPRFILTHPVHARNFDAVVSAENQMSANCSLDLGFTSKTLDKDSLYQQWDALPEYCEQFNRFSTENPHKRRLAEVCADLGDRNLLPQDVVALKKQQWRLKLLVHQAGNSEPWGPEPIRFQQTISHDAQKDTYRVTSSIVKTIKNKENNKEEDVEVSLGNYLGYSHIMKCNNAFLPLYNHLNDDLSAIINENGQIKKGDILDSSEPLTENHVVLTDKTSTLSQEEIRDLRTLFVNQEDLPFNTIAVFEKYLPKLASLSFQEFFDMHFYKPGVLTNYLDRHREFINTISDFVKHGINFFEILNKWEACLFFAEIGERIGQSPWKFPSRLSLLRKWYASTQDPRFKARISHHILSWYARQEKIETYQLEEIYRAYVYVKIYPLPNEHREPLLVEGSEKLLNALNNVGPGLNRHPDVVNKTCEGILHDALVNKNAASLWNGTHPTLKQKKEAPIIASTCQREKSGSMDFPLTDCQKKLWRIRHFKLCSPKRVQEPKRSTHILMPFKILRTLPITTSA